MMDFNFFEPYIIEKQSNIPRKQLILYAFISVIAIGVIVLPIVNQLTIRKIQNQTISVFNTVESENVQSDIKKIDSLQMQIQEIEEYYNTLKSIDDEFKNIDIINDLFIHTVTDRVPQGVFFEKMNIIENRVKISGIAKDNKSIAEFQQNLGEVPYFTNVFIPHISTNTGAYVFTISFEIKGGIYDETN